MRGKVRQRDREREERRKEPCNTGSKTCSDCSGDKSESWTRDHIAHKV